jgi:hypothetical protein
MLNQWRRHSFLGVTLMSVVFLKVSFLHSSQTTSVAPVEQAMDLMRELNLIQVDLAKHARLPDGTVVHTYASKTEMLSSKEPGLAWQVQTERAQANTPYGAFLRSLVPNDRNNEILPGWTTDIDIKKDGYVIISSQKIDPVYPNKIRQVVITDETGLICRARFAGSRQPAAADLQESEDFPGATPWDLYHE